MFPVVLDRVGGRAPWTHQTLASDLEVCPLTASKRNKKDDAVLIKKKDDAEMIT
jgi:hypothetical protein